MKKIVAKEGPLGLYAGMESTFWRLVSRHLGNKKLSSGFGGKVIRFVMLTCCDYCSGTYGGTEDTLDASSK